MGLDKDGKANFDKLLKHLLEIYKLSEHEILKALKANDTEKIRKLNLKQYRNTLDYLDSLEDDYSSSEPEMNISNEFNNLNRNNRSQSF